MSKGLGRGLSALISEKQIEITPLDEDAGSNEARRSLLLAAMFPSPFQPRTHFDETELNELAESIKQNGVIQPVVVRPAKEKDKFEIIAGERRWRAAKIANLAAIPVIIMHIDDKKALEIAIVENVQRQNLMILEEADGYRRLIEEFNYTQEELADVIGKSRSQVANTLRLLGLPEQIKGWLNEKKLTTGHARALLAADQAEEAAEVVIKKGLNVRQTEALVKKYAKFPREQQRTRKARQKSDIIRKLEKELTQKLGLDIRLSGDGTTGEVNIRYNSANELQDILERLEQ